ncbi:MAG: SDR family oxidoreductase [Thermodesulfobacteriota bacterium]|nr:SDR family oxidoreductase [Thermodesulfobacteriota bacterium]
MELKGKAALVLGAIKGIGKGIGLALAKEGVKVCLNYYDWEESLQQMEQDFRDTGTAFHIVRTNLLDTDAIPSLVESAVSAFGHLDILINNIERGGWPVVHGPYNQGQWDLEMATTLRAKWWVYNSAIPYLKASGNGAVVNISSIAGLVGRSGAASPVFNDGYAAANRAVSSFTETWAREAAPEVRVNELMLGLMETRHGPNTRGWDLLSEKQRQEIINHTPLGRMGNIEDVAKAVLFMIRDAPFMTGGSLRIDGGYVLGGEHSEPMPRGVLE